MFTKQLLLTAGLFISIVTYSQNIAINADGSLPDNSAMLEVKSTSKGMLVPRMLQSQRIGITLPATGLLVYQTDGTQGFYYNPGTPAVPNWTYLNATGPQGIQGIQGVQGPAGATEYAYIYNTSAQFVSLGNAVSFDANGMSTSGITHTPGSTFIFVNITGVYKIEFSVSSLQTSQFSIYRNGLSVTGSRYGTATAATQNTGAAILSLTAGDVVQLNNTGSSTSVNLVLNTGGTQTAVNASIMITKL
jgi:hypothetical protein